MFERRLKILLVGIAAITLLLVLRSGQLQVINGDAWRKKASESMQRPTLVETTRGRILDFRGRELAIDEPCTDACVDYRAISLNEEWIKGVALDRLKMKMARDYAASDRKQREKLLTEEIARVHTDIDAMWEILAQKTGKPIAEAREEIDQTRRAIRQRVQMCRRLVWYNRYNKAMTRHDDAAPDPWYRRWVVWGGDDGPDLDSFAVTVDEQERAHVILHAIDDQTYIDLGKILHRAPGLELRRSKHRLYPYGANSCHVIGTMSMVMRQDIDEDDDELTQLRPNDQIGRTGLEALADKLLRGRRGRILRVAGQEKPVESNEPTIGRDVRATIDVELQQTIIDAFALERKSIEYRSDTTAEDRSRSNLHGAAVLIDVPTGEVRAMVSCPGYDLNQFDQLYPALNTDDLNLPLLNRATQDVAEPGSTAKLIMALGVLQDRVMTPADTIECTGYLVLAGVRYSFGRCWTMRQFHIAHHATPPAAHPTGFLTVSDALERSCNVFYETVADRLGLDRVAYWYDRLGLGRITGVGIDESRGRIPRAEALSRSAIARRSTLWSAGIGQGEVGATPLHMANLAATIARDGVWMKPRLLTGLSAEDQTSLRWPVSGSQEIPDRVDLGFRPEVLAAVHEGMFRVVNGPPGAATGRTAAMAELSVAGKTGSAQVPKLRIRQRDAAGKVMLLDNGRIDWKPIEPDAYSWYQGVGDNHENLAHAWFVGYAPADNPKLAIAVLVEYGGSGGAIAGRVAKDILEECRRQGYLGKAAVGGQ